MRTAKHRPHILIVCTGNLCRSPMAQVYLQHRFRSLAIPATVESAGIMAAEGYPAPPQVQRVVAAMGLDLSTFRSRPLMPGMIRRADWILVMEPWHRSWILSHFPAFKDRVVLLGSFLDGADDALIPDPYGESLSVYQFVWNLLRHAVDRWLDTWLASSKLIVPSSQRSVSESG